VGRPSASIHVLTLFLTALLAWPWNVVLSTAESSQIALQLRLVSIHALGSLRVQRILRHGWWNPQSCSVIAPDYDRDEEEGDDGIPLSLSSDLSAIEVFRGADPPASSPTTPIFPAGTIPQEHLCRLRC
jgi:hypothetical protein